MTYQPDNSAKQLFKICFGLSFAVGGFLGFALGPEVRAIDGALVLAGVVHYPEYSVMGAYFRNVWTLLHQLPAGMLALGFPADAVHILMNVIFVGATFSGISLLTFALARSITLAIVVALAVVVGGRTLAGPDYPILFFTGHIFGMGAMALVYLAIGLLANRRWLAASVIVGLLPSVHPVIGGWMLGITMVLATVAWYLPDRARCRSFGAGMLIGLSVSVLSLVVHLAMRVSYVGLPDSALLQAYLDFWDFHRSVPYDPYVREYSMIPAVLALAYLVVTRSGARRSAEWGIAALLLSIIGSTVLYEWFHLSHETLPDIVARVIPSRFVNIHYALFLPIIVGILFAIEPYPINRLSAVVIVILFLVPRRWGLDPIFHPILTQMWSIVLAALACVLAVTKNRRRIADALRSSRHLWSLEPTVSRWLESIAVYVQINHGGIVARLTRLQRFGCRIRAGATLLSTAARPLLIAVLAAPIIYYGFSQFSKLTWSFSDFAFGKSRESQEFFDRLRSMPLEGPVLVPNATALATHRYGHKPIVLDPTSMDFVPYMPETVNDIAGIVTDLYGIDFRNPPPPIRNRGALPADAGKEYWAHLRPDEWATLAKRYCIGGIVVPADWPLQIKLALDRGGYRLFVPSVGLPERCTH